MSAKATHIFSAKKFQHICISLDVNFNELLTNDVVSFEQLGPGDNSGNFFSFLHKAVCYHNSSEVTRQNSTNCIQSH